ncbi:VTT domain-containing protein [Candidatus Peregrinibacteria bacterium]|nr:VTT domain-containing protein [Candidatus Peregrinibacteria bacterium]
MTFLHAVFLGLLQGLTEFLPVSSSGHLALAEVFLALPLSTRDLQGFDIMLHGGSLIALLLCYIDLWWKMARSLVTRDRASRRLLGIIILASIPAAAAGFFLEAFIALQFRSLVSLSVQLLVSGLILLLAERFTPRGRMETLRPVQGLMIGIAQAFALVPGLSRSGLTIAAGRAVGLSRTDAVNFSFLMALPVIAGATVLTAFEAYQGVVTLPPLPITAAGFMASLIASLVAIWTLRRFAYRLSMNWFAAYLILLSLVALGFHFHLESLSDPAVVELWLKQYGWIGIFLFALIETTPPLSFFSPGVLALILGGALVDNPVTGILFFVAAVCGMAVGNGFFYLLGFRYGRRFAHRVRLTERRMDLVDEFMRRFGKISILLGQCAGALRPVISFTAGTVRIPPRVFIPFMLVGAAVVAGALLTLGFLLRTHLQWVLSIVGVGGALLVALAVVLVWFLERRLRKNRR